MKDLAGNGLRSGMLFCLCIALCASIASAQYDLPDGSSIPPPPLTEDVGPPSNTVFGKDENHVLPPPPLGNGEVEGDGEVDSNEEDSIMDKIFTANKVDADGEHVPREGGHGLKQMFEGDIVYDNALREEITMMMDGVISQQDAINNGAWPKGVIPYSFSSSFPYSGRGRTVVYEAIRDFQKYTCLKFVKRTNQRDYIQFFVGGGCYSQIGRRGGRQMVSLGHGCQYKGIAIHEIMHALGFFHEQSRRDRDRYITINFRNIQPAMRYNFNMYRSGEANTQGEPYDKKSVMHYGNTAFSINGQKTIVSKSNYREVLGQRSGMSQIDVRQINKYYRCGNTKPTPKPTTKPGGGKTCKDGYPFCSTLKSWCTKNSWVAQNCKKTCQVDKSRYCASWARGGYCTNKKYQKWMYANCKKSCNVC